MKHAKIDANPCVIWLTMPHRSLSPNSRTNWRAWAKHTKAARNEAMVTTMQVCSHQRPYWHAVTARTTFYVPDKRRRDVRNLDAMLKPCWDGFVDAGLLVDDDRITHLPSEIVVEQACVPTVEFRIWETLEGDDDGV